MMTKCKIEGKQCQLMLRDLVSKPEESFPGCLVECYVLQALDGEASGQHQL